MDHKKVLHITYDMRIGGTEMVIKNIIDGSDNSSFIMSIFCIESPIGPWGEELRSQGIKVISAERRAGFDTSLIHKLRQYIKTNTIDIIHCHQYTPWVYGALAAVTTKAKVIFTEHGRFYPDSSSLKRWLINPILSLMTERVTAISYATKRALSEFEYISENKIDVIYNGIEPAQFSQDGVREIKKKLNIPSETLVLGTIARLDSIKNHKLMIAAFNKSLTENKNRMLVIVGDGDERENIEAQIKHLGLEQKVILTGYVNPPYDYLASFDVFLLSSFSEGTAMTLLEAMSLSKPCITTNTGGSPEVILHNINGIVTQNDDVEDLSNALQTIESSDLRASMGIAGAKVFQEKFTLDIMIKSYHSLYAKLV